MVVVVLNVVVGEKVAGDVVVVKVVVVTVTGSVITSGGLAVEEEKLSRGRKRVISLCAYCNQDLSFCSNRELISYQEAWCVCCLRQPADVDDQ